MSLAHRSLVLRRAIPGADLGAGRHRHHGQSRFPQGKGRTPRHPRRRRQTAVPTALYHRAECLTHVGDSQAVRSLTQCGEPMRFAMAAPIDLRNDFDSVSLRRLAKRTRARPRAVVCWRWPRSTMVAAGRMRRGSAASVCRSFATGCCASTPADRTGWSMGSHRAHPRSSTPITAAHWRRLLRPARSRRSTASCAGGARTWRGGSWRRSPSRSTRPRSGAS